MEHEEKTHTGGWWMIERDMGDIVSGISHDQLDETLQEEESDTTMNIGNGKSFDGTRIRGEMGHDGERRKAYTA